MPTFENFAHSHSIKMLFVGNTGAGKTGSTASLAAAGYNVRILDLDKGVELLDDYILNPDSMYRKPRAKLWTAEQCAGIEKRMSYVTLDESMLIKQSQVIPKGDLWNKISGQLDKWKDGEQDFGNIESWTIRDVLVIDGLSRLSDAAFNYQLAMNGRLLGRPEQSDFGMAQRNVERLLMLLYSSAIKCHVILICHIAFIETEGGPTRGFPQTIGKAISPKIGQYFNHALLAKTSGQGEATKRVILTNTSGMIELKSAAPLRVKGEYELATGLAEYFRDVLGPGAQGKGEMKS